MATGLNGIILITSKKYRFDLFFSVLLIGLMVIMNLIFIPKYGMAGAALGTMLATIVQNTARTIFVAVAFKIHPFEMKNIWVIAAAALVVAINYFLPFIFNIYVDILIRSTIVTFIFIMPVIAFKVSQDVNDFVRNSLNRIGIGG
jgi:O-antigen/teichoic acid export membrane protein